MSDGVALKQPDIPPLPPGFTLDAPKAAAPLPPLPKGFTLDAPNAKAAPAAAAPAEPGLLDKLGPYVPESILGLAAGATSGIASALKGLGGQNTAALEGRVEGAKARLAIMDAIDKGEDPPQLSISGDDLGTAEAYKAATPEERKGFRASQQRVLDTAVKPGAVTDDPLYNAGAATQKWSDEQFKAANGFENSWTRMFTEAAGSSLPFVASRGIGATALGGAMSAGQQIDDAVAKGASKEDILKAVQWGSLPGLTEDLPIEVAFSKVPLPQLGRFTNAVIKVLKTQLAEGGQEGLQQAAQNIIAKYTYSPNQDIEEGVAQSAALGAAVGATYSAPIALGEALTEPAQKAAPAAAGSRPATPASGTQPAEPVGEWRGEPTGGWTAAPGLPAPPPGFTIDQPPAERARGADPAAPGSAGGTASPPAVASPVAPEERATLRKMQWPDADIDGMSPDERAAEVERAQKAGLTVSPEEVNSAGQYSGEQVAGPAAAAPATEGAGGPPPIPAPSTDPAAADLAARIASEARQPAPPASAEAPASVPAQPTAPVAPAVPPAGAIRQFGPQTGTLGVPRDQMPQIKAEHRGALVNFLNARGIESQQETVAPETLKPTQAEFDLDKVRKAAGFTGTDRSILVSSDNHVLDGHHQWLAKHAAKQPVKIIRLNAPIADLMSVVREFPSATKAKLRKKPAPIAEPTPIDVKLRKRGAIKNPDIIQFIAMQGGVKDFGGELKSLDLKRRFVPGWGRVVRERGKPLDTIREAAAQAGYFDHIYGDPDTATHKSTIADLLRLIDQNESGLRALTPQGQYGREQIAVETGTGAGDSTQSGLDDSALSELEALGFKRDDPFTERALMIMREHDLHAVDAVEQASMQFDQERDTVTPDTPSVPFFEATDEVQPTAAPPSSAPQRAAGERGEGQAAQGGPEGVGPPASDGGKGGAAVGGKPDAEGAVEGEPKRGPRESVAHEPRQGEAGMHLAAGEVVLTATGRETSPFPKVSVETDRKTAATVKRVDQWLMQNALDEARARGDEFNARQFDANLAKPSPADKDSAEFYLFDKESVQPVQRPLLKPLTAAPTAEPGAEGKPQLVLPGAEKISDKALAERTAAKPMRAKAEQKEPGGLFSDDSKQTDLVDLARQKPKAVAPVANEPMPSPTKIEDFGEKIEGARKDMVREFADSLSADVDIATEPLSKIFPQPDYEKLAEAGVNKASLAMIAVAREQIPSKPRKGYKVARWAEQVRVLRDFASKLMTGDYSDPEAIAERMRGTAFLRNVADTAKVIEELDPALLPAAAKWKVQSGSFSTFMGYKGPPKTFYYLLDDKGRFVKDPLGAVVSSETLDGLVNPARAILNAALGKEDEAAGSKKLTPTGIYQDRTTKVFFIGFKGQSGVIRLKAGFESAKDARSYRDEHADELQAAIDEMRTGPQMRRPENRPREGIARREGDVSPEQFQEAFGFRGVQFGNYVETKRRQFELNEAFDGLMDLADVIGIPPAALSLDGKLGLAFGARGRGGAHAAMAHYEPSQVVINLTKAKGAGSLAHEWFHAVDDYFAHQDTGRSAANVDFMTTRGENTTGAVRPEVRAAFAGVRKSLTGGAYSARMQKIDEARSKPYWNTMIEKAARGFEKYVVDRLAAQRATNDYLANIDENAGAYPRDAEMRDQGITAAFDDLFKAIEVKGGTKLYQALAAPGDINTKTHAFKRWFGDSKVVDAKGEPLVVYHGTQAAQDFAAFKRRPGDVGIHFGTAGQANDRIGYMAEHGRPTDGMRIMPVYLAIKNPIRLKDAGAWNLDNLDYQLRDAFPKPDDQNRIRTLKTNKDIREFLQSKGYDGIVYKNEGETAGADELRAEAKRLRAAVNDAFGVKFKGSFSVEDQQNPAYKAWSRAEENYTNFRKEHAEDSWIAFDPAQIKSVNNRGTFDPTDPRILYEANPSSVSHETTVPASAVPPRSISDAEVAKVREIVRRVAGIEPQMLDAIQADANPDWGVNEPTFAGGYYDFIDHTIAVALHGGTLSTAYHEAFHHIQRVFLNARERSILAGETERLRRIVALKPGREAQAADMSREEVEAEAFAIWSEQMDRNNAAGIRLHIAIRRAWERMRQTLRRIRNALRGRGYQTAEDIFGAAYRGETHGRKGKWVTLPNGKTQFQPAYHGSPHDFDEFKSDRIGTGEGAQAFGYGLYFAGKKEIAQYYRDKLSEGRATFSALTEDENAAIPDWIVEKVKVGHDAPLRSRIGSLQKDIDFTEADLVALREQNGDKEYGTLADDIYRFEINLRSYQTEQNALKKLLTSGDYSFRNPGKLYEVDLPEDSELMQWDAPLSEQPEGVREKLNAVMSEQMNPKVVADVKRRDVTGAEFYKELAKGQESGTTPRSGDQKQSALERAASEALRAAGIPGHRYADNTSRIIGLRILSPDESVSGKWVVGQAPNGPNQYFNTEAEARAAYKKIRDEQSYNYVVYDDSRVKVTRKYQAVRADERVPAVPPRAVPGALVMQRINAALAARPVIAKLKGMSPRDRKTATDQESAKDYLTRKLEDYLHPLRMMQEEGGHSLTELNNPYMNARIAGGEGKAHILTMHDMYVKPMTDTMAAGGVTVRELDQYAKAMHAQERNEVVGARNEHKVDKKGNIVQRNQLRDAVTDHSIVGASGQSTNEANSTLAAFRASPKIEALRQAHGYLMQMLKTELRNARRAGLIDDETYRTLTEQWKNYVPLKGMDGMDDEGHWKPGSSGFDVRGKEWKTALGRFSEAENSIAHAIVQTEQSIIRQHENPVGKSILRFLNEFDPKGEHYAQVFWAGETGMGDIVKAESVYKREMGKDGKVKLVKMPNPFSSRDDVLATKVGGKTYYIRFKDPKVGYALRKLSVVQLGPITKIFRHVSVWQSIVNTRANPAFAPLNVIRDVLTAAVHLLDEGFTVGQIARVMKDIPKAYGALWRQAKGKPNDSEWDRYAAEWNAGGGKISFHGFSTMEETLHDLEKQVNRGINGQNQFLAAWQTMKKFIGQISDTGENGTRLAAYVGARRLGRSPKESVFLARDLTVDFEKHGEVGPWMNSWFTFFNASLQGNMNVVRRVWRSKAVKKAVVGIMLSGLMQHFWNLLMAGDDDNGENYYKKLLATEPWKLERQFVFFIPNSGGRYVSFPMPWGYNAFYHAGIQGGAMMTGDTKPLASLADTLRVYWDAFNPIGSGSIASMISPTVTDPAVDLYFNQNFTGKPIYPSPNPFDRSPPPRSSQSFSTTWWPYKTIAEGLNKLSFGDDVMPGAVDVYPDALEHLAGYVVGGLGRFLSQGAQTVTDAMQGEVHPEKVPWARSFFGQPNKDSLRGEYFDKRQSVLAAGEYLKNYEDTGDEAKVNSYQAEHAVELDALPAFKAAEKQRKSINKERRRIEADTEMTSAERTAALDDLAQQELEAMKEARRAYVEAAKSASGN